MNCKNRCIRFIFLIAVLVAGSKFSAAQDAMLQSMFASYSSKGLYEKLYVQTDKNFYMAGDVVWFSIYNVDGTKHQPLNLSKVAYVEVLDKLNKPVLQAKIALNKGKGSGSFLLPVSLNSANYKLRAYTNWMKNAGPDYFFEKQLSIVNGFKVPQEPAAVALMPANADFFPEGGHLVANINSQVAFRVTDQFGRGINCTGVVLNDKNDTVAVFKTHKFGIGRFSFTPLTNTTYKAEVWTADGKKLSAEVPAVQSKGYVMQVTEVGDQLKIKITTNIISAAANQQVYVAAQTRHAFILAESSALRNGMAEFSIAKDKLGEGITQLTAFSQDRQPVCERLYFKQPVKKLSIEATVDKAVYATRQKVNLSVLSKDEQSQMASSALSLSVYKMDSLATIGETSLLSYLWLSSDLKGRIDSADYYFSNTDALAADNLMMSHGWRRFNWQSVVKNEAPAFEFAPEYNGHIVTGKIVNAATGSPAKQVPVYLSVPGAASHLSITESDDDGNIRFYLPAHYGAGQVVVQAHASQGNMYRIEIRNPFSGNYSSTKVSPFVIPQTREQSLVAQNVSMQVQQAYYSDSIERFNSPLVDTTPFYGVADKSYLLDEFTRFTTMEEVLNEYVTEVILTKRDGKFYPHVLKGTQGPQEGEPLVLLDGVPVDGNQMVSYDPMKVRKLEVVVSRYVLGSDIYGGIVHFITYKSGMENLKLDAGAIIMDYEGLQMKREFYSPDYENGVPSAMPDFRNLLFWSPGINTDANGKAQLSFFTSDLSGEYIGVIEGMDENGRAGKKVFMFEVNKDRGL
jgi:hypothetical protein